MKKRFTALSLIMLLVAGMIVGCGKTSAGNDENGTQTEEKDSSESSSKKKGDKNSKVWYDTSLDEAFLCTDYVDHTLLVCNFEIISNMDGEFGEYMFDEPVCTIDGTEFRIVYLDGYTNEYYLPPVDKIEPYGSAIKQYAFDVTDVDLSTATAHITMGTITRKDAKVTQEMVDETLKLSELDDRTTYVPEEPKEFMQDISIENVTLSDDGEEGYLLVVDYLFTNRDEEPKHIQNTFKIDVRQNGERLETGWLPKNHELKESAPDTDQFTDCINGETALHREVYILKDAESDVTLKITKNEDDEEYYAGTIDLTGEATASEDVIVADHYEALEKYAYEEKYTLEAAYSIGHKPTVFHLAQITNLTDEEIGSLYYTEFYQGDVQLDSIYLSRVMQHQMAPGDTFGMIWGCYLENETDDVRIVVIDQKSYDKEVIFDKTYTMKEIKDSVKYIPDGYKTESMLNELFDDGVITEMDFR